MSTATNKFEERKLIRKANLRSELPITWIQYEAGWAAFQQKPTVQAVAAGAKVTRAQAAHLMEVGYPEHEMIAYGERIAQVRKVARQISDYNHSRAMAENGQILRGIKIKMRQAFGKNFENISFDQKSLGNLTPNKALVLTKFMKELMHLESYALREGEEETKIRIEHHTASGNPSEASSKLALLINNIEDAVSSEPFANTDEDQITPEHVDQAFAVDFEDLVEDGGAAHSDKVSQ